MAKGQGGRPLERKCLSSSDFKEKIILKFVDISLPNHILLFHSSGFKGGKSPQIAKSQRNGKILGSPRHCPSLCRQSPLG